MFKTIRALIAVSLGVLTIPAHAEPTLTTLFSFDYGIGAYPIGTPVVDPTGTVFGTTQAYGPAVYGTPFSLSGPSRSTLTTLVAFDGVIGSTPNSSLVADASGTLYGLVSGNGLAQPGAVYSLSGADHRTYAMLATLPAGNAIGSFGVLAVGPDGTLYGATNGGPAGSTGIVFSLSGTNHETFTTLAVLDRATTGASPTGLIVDASNNVFVSTTEGGPGGDGTVLELSGADHGTVTTLAAFSNDGGPGNPFRNLALDAAGNLYGAAALGGSSNLGALFELSGPGLTTLTTLASFDEATGVTPQGGVLIDAAGNLYGTTSYLGANGDGTIFRYSSTDGLSVLHAFDGLDGDSSLGGLTADASGNLYGTTYAGGEHDLGTVFELSGAGFVTPQAGAGSGTAIPEPGSAGLVALGLAGFLTSASWQGGSGRFGLSWLRSTRSDPAAAPSGANRRSRALPRRVVDQLRSQILRITWM